MAAASLLRVENLKKSFGSVRALRGVDFEVSEGEVCCVIGPSGCGKSTLLRCINFLEEPEEGLVHFDGRPVGFLPGNGRRRRDAEGNINRMRAQIGMVFQHFNVWPHLSALGNVMKPLVVVRGASRETAERLAAAALARVGLADKIGSYPSQLSGGQLQRVAIARTLAMDPKLVLFDEPTSALDPELVAEVLAVLHDIARAGTTMLIVTHELGFASQVAHRLLFMDEGRIVEEGTPHALLYRPHSDRLKLFLSRVLRNT